MRSHPLYMVTERGGAADLYSSLSTADATHISAEADAAFDKIDLNGDGVISFSELKQYLEDATDLTTKVFDFLDTNADGAISRQELRDGLCRCESAKLRQSPGLTVSPSPAQPAEHLDEACCTLADEFFETIDSNHDGKITHEELRNHLKSMRYQAETVTSIFKTLDLNGDGEVSRDELRSCFQRYEFRALRLALGVLDS